MSVDRAAPVAGILRGRDALARIQLGCGLALLVGEAPNAATVGRPTAWLAPDGTRARHAGNRLAAWSGLSARSFLTRFDRTNLFDRPREPWSGSEARDRAAMLLPEAWTGPRPLVLLGRKVADAFGYSGPSFPGWYRWNLRVRLGALPEEAQATVERRRLVDVDGIVRPPPGEPLPLDDELRALFELVGGAGRWPAGADLASARRRGVLLVATVPHPSTRSRLWNDKAQTELARGFWRQLVASLEAWQELENADAPAAPAC